MPRLCVLVRAMGVVSRPDSSIQWQPESSVQAEHTGIHGVFHDIPGGEDNGDARTGDAFDGAGPVLDDGGMPHAHALDVGDGVVFPAGESADARDVSDSHDSVPCCQLKDQWTCVT